MSYWSKNWLFEPIFDKEFKQYQILGFEQASTAHFRSFRIYPYLDHLKRQIDLLHDYLAASERIESSLKPNLIGVSLSNAELKYGDTPPIDKGLEDWMEVLAFAKMKLRGCLEIALSQYQEAEGSVEIIPIGLRGERVQDGLLFIRRLELTRVYKFELRTVRRAPSSESYRDMRTTLLDQTKTSSFTDFSELKWHYYRNERWLHGIDAFLVETSTDLPHFECVLPLVKNRLLNQA